MNCFVAQTHTHTHPKLTHNHTIMNTPIPARGLRAVLSHITVHIDLGVK